jgi:hypothetical protein
MDINEAKYILRNNPLVIIEKPKLLLYLPAIILKSVINNLKINQDVVYFVETKISDFLEHNDLLHNSSMFSNELWLKHLTSFSAFIPFLSIRQKEDTSAGIAYKTTLEKRFSHNSEAFVLFHKSIPVGYIFIQKEKVTIPQVRTTFTHTRNSFSFIDLYIYKDARGNKYHEILYLLIVEKLSKSGYEHFWCWLMEHNQISIKAHVRIGISNVTKIITRKSLFFFSVTRIKDQNFCLSRLIRAAENDKK